MPGINYLYKVIPLVILFITILGASQVKIVTSFLTWTCVLLSFQSAMAVCYFFLMCVDESGLNIAAGVREGGENLPRTRRCEWPERVVKTRAASLCHWLARCKLGRHMPTATSQKTCLPWDRHGVLERNPCLPLPRDSAWRNPVEQSQIRPSRERTRTLYCAMDCGHDSCCHGTGTHGLFLGG